MHKITKKNADKNKNRAILLKIRRKFLKKIAILFIFYILLQSCNIDYVENGLVLYNVSSPDFLQVDNIQFQDVNGDMIDTGSVELPWTFFFEFDNVDVYHMEPVHFTVYINASNNLNGGTLTTKCYYSEQLQNHEKTINYDENIAIEQYTFAAIHRQNF